MQSRVELTRQLVHELKTPLTSLLATSQLLSEETRGTRLSKLAGYVLDGAARLNSRIDELHDITKGELGKLKLEPMAFRLEALLTSVAEETRAFAASNGVSVSLGLPCENLPEVYADVERVRQVMLNLINNACKYASSGRRIDVVARNPDDLPYVLIEVRDYGPGIGSRRMKTCSSRAI